MHSFIWTVLLGSQLDGQTHVEDVVVLEKDAILDFLRHYVLDPSYFVRSEILQQEQLQVHLLGVEEGDKNAVIVNVRFHMISFLDRKTTEDLLELIIANSEQTGAKDTELFSSVVEAAQI